MEYAELKTKKARIAFIKEKVSTNKAWAKRALLRIFENQTADEQRSEVTQHHNGIGFTGADAEILTSLTKQLLDRGTLSEKQWVVLHRRLPKYARQLEVIASQHNQQSQPQE